MKLDSAQWRTLSGLLDQVLDLDEPARQAWLATLRDGDVAFKPLLAELLSRPADAETDDFLQSLPPFEVPDLRESVFTAGGHVGPYRLLRELGRGGMGEVWLAERADGLLKRKVALKLPLLATARGVLAERFARERELLAPLVHPHIARLYDAGFDADGQPYLALEYVDGVPLTRYADDHRLGTAERIALFGQVLDAVAHAHASLVLHRDLKPSNILVTPQGEVKLLDFGIAKLLHEGEASETALTRLAGSALTLDYASPEQIAGAPLTTAADVYALGVVLYELVTGERPYRLKRRSRAELEEAIAAADPVPPSHAHLVDSVANARATTVRRLRRTLAGDLDTIVLKALRKRPGDRYPSAAALGEDLERYRRGAPVLAQPDSITYRTLKFVNRHRVSLSAGGLVAVTLMGATTVALHQARIAGIEAKRADASRNFLVDLFQHAARNNPGGAAAADTTLRQLLDIGSRKVLEDAHPDPELQLDVSQLLARLNLELDLIGTASKLTERSIALARHLHGDGSLPVAYALAQKADNLYRAGSYVDAIEVSRQVLAIADQAPAQAGELRARAHVILGNSQHQIDSSKTVQPLRHLETALALLTEVHSTTEDRSRAAYFIAWILETEGDFARAEAYYTDGIAAGRANFGERSFIVAFGYEGLADMMRKQRRFAEARETIGKAIDIYEYVLGPKHATVAFAKTNLALIEAAVGRRAEAERMADEALAVAKEVFGAKARQIGYPALQDARLKSNRGELEAAARVYDEALIALAGAEPASSLTNRAMRIEYAEMLIAMGQTARAKTILDEAEAGFEAARDTQGVRAAWLRLARGELALATGDTATGAVMLDHVLDRLSAKDTGAVALSRLLAVALARSRPTPERAQAMLRKLDEYGLLASSPEALTFDVEDNARLEFAIGRLYLAAGRRDDARTWLSSAVALREQLDAPQSPWLGEARMALAEAGSPADAR